ncbi:MAG: GntR family transcriptional regulator [Sphaerochaetaceae bacterium]
MMDVMPLKTELKNTKMFNILKKMIIYNEFEPGSRLVIKDLCNLFQVSSSPVRDALHFLESEGLVRNNGNFFCVLKLNEVDVEEIYSIRQVLEPFALTQAFDAMDRRELQSLLDRMETHGNAATSFVDDMDFHSLIIDSCKNSYLEKELHFLANQSYQIGFRFHSITNNRTESKDEHMAVIRAILADSKNEACTLLERHLCNSKERILRFCF